VRDELGLVSVVPMLPFVRNVEERTTNNGKYGPKRGLNGLRVFMICELPVNCLVEEFATLVDGYSIGSNDLIQPTLGLDRDCEKLQHIFDESNPAVKFLISNAIRICKKNKNRTMWRPFSAGPTTSKI
jgi:pyruvate,water dikinase